MPSPIGHAMVGAATAWISEISSRDLGADAAPKRRRWWSLPALALNSLTPLAVACAVLAVSPDFDNFFHTHRTYSHSFGAAAIVWLLAALVAWRLRLPILRVATTCAAAYASHVVLDWLGRDDGPHHGLMVWWPLTREYYRSGLNLFLEFATHPRMHFTLFVTTNAYALAREIAILLPPVLFVWLVRVEAFAGLTSQLPRSDETA